MFRGPGACLVVLGVLLAAPAAAQDDAPGPPGPYVIDVRGAFSSLSTDRRLEVLLPQGATPPSRGLGGEVGVHVYPFGLGPVRVGIGASLVRVMGRRAPVNAQAATATTPAVGGLPGVSTTLTTLAPQLSLNFGSADGWSYLSGGIGRARFQSEILLPAGETTTDTGSTASTTDTTTLTNTVMDSGQLNIINIGGGARWFAKSHLAVGFDLRFHRLPPGSLGAATATTIIVAAVGVGFR